MTKTSRNSLSATEAAFHKHYAAIWGEERWNNSLYPALVRPTRQAALVSRYVPSSSFQAAFEKSKDYENLEGISFPFVENSGKTLWLDCFAIKYHDPNYSEASNEKDRPATLPQPKLAMADNPARRLMTHWNLDAASALAAHVLNVQPGENVLDLCAAPGGKSIALAQTMWPQLYAQHSMTSPTANVGHLRSNESNPARFKRLTDNIKAYLPPQLLTSKYVATLNIESTDPMAARKLAISTAGYDKVLVDAPCSSERHIIHAHLAAKTAGHSAPEMANWRPGSSKRLAKTQVDLLMTGLRSARIGGSVLYATCSIESTENDGVVDKVLAAVEKEVKKVGKWSVKTGFNGGEGDSGLEEVLEREWAERTKYGWIVLPDHPAGGLWGPLFFVVFTKVKADG